MKSDETGGRSLPRTAEPVPPTAECIIHGSEAGYVDLLNPDYIREHFVAQQEPVNAIPTPLAKWNRHCRDEGGGVGLAYGWHVTIAGATGKGKSLLALNMAARAIKLGHAVGFVSFEMSQPQIATRLYAIATKTPVRGLERGNDFSLESAQEAYEKLGELTAGGQFFTNDGPLRDVHDAIELMERWREERMCRLFILDYLQLAQPWNAESEYQAVSQVSFLVRQFAQEHHAVTVGLSQFNRGTSVNRSDKPTIEGLKSTSSLEQDSDQVILLDHSRYDRSEGGSGPLAKTFVLLGKNRHGATGEIPVEWDYRTLTLREPRDDEVCEWPGI